MRRIWAIVGLLGFLFVASATTAQVGQIPGWPPLTTTVPCADTTLHTVTTQSASSTTIPSGCNHLSLGMIGPGGSGAALSTSSWAVGGGGGAFAGDTNINVTPGGTLWWDLFAGGAGVTYPTAGNNGAGKPWANVASNAAPVSSTTGVVADFGLGGGNASGGQGGLTANSIGQTLWGGGNGWNPSSYGAGGGGSSACSTAAGTNATSSAGATACSGGGNGGGVGIAGSPPGGGSGGIISGTSGAGGNSQLTYQFSAFLDLPPANDNFAMLEQAA